MHIIRPYETAITLFGADGTVYSYASLKEALKTLGIAWIRNHVGEHFRVFSHHEVDYGRPAEAGRARPVYKHHAYIMRDDAGCPVTAAHFSKLLPRRRYNHYTWLYGSWNGEGAVPRTGKSRGGHYYRRPGTTAERRASFVIAEEGEVAPRAARNAANLVNAWDDYRVSCREDRNWKRFRKTQWKTS